MTPDMENAANAIHWLEEQWDKFPDTYFHPKQIAQATGVSLQIVLDALHEVEGVLVESIVIKNTKCYQFRKEWRIQEELANAINAGHMEEVEPGKYRLTQQGIQHVERQLKTNPNAQEFMNRLHDAYGSKPALDD